MIRKALSLFVSVMIVLMSVSFAVSINAKEVFAEEITGCCVLDDSGNYCVDESVEGSCSGSFYSGISCSAIERESANIPSPCERVTCLEDDGSCSAQKYYKQCRDHSNSGFFEVPLSEVNECQEGCCQLLSEGEVVNQYSVSFLGQCTIDAASLGLTSNLLSECESLPEQIGCCVSNFGCDMTSNADCSGLDWFGEEMCSDRPTLCGDCGDYVNKECYQGDVYLANSCGEYDDNPISDCNVNTQMCKIEDEEAQCVDISCEIPLEFTTLNYDTFYLKSGEIGVIREDGSASRIHVDDNYVINLDNNEQVCVQYGGPGEVHHMYACDRGEVKDSSISLFKGRSRICEFNGTSGKLEIRENKYQECLECSSVDDSIGDNNLYKIYKWFAKLGDLAGWSAVDISYWDYWLFDPGLCNSPGDCSDKGDCVYGDSNWCVPKYPVDSYSGCNSFTESKAGSPYNKPDSACQSCGNCKKYNKPIGVVGTGAICLANIVVGGFTDWLMEGMANALLSEDEVDKVEDREADHQADETVDEDSSSKDSDEVPNTGRVRSAYNTARSIVSSFKNDYLDEVVWPILKKVITLGGVFSVSDFRGEAKAYFGIDQKSISEGKVKQIKDEGHPYDGNPNRFFEGYILGLEAQASPPRTFSLFKPIMFSRDATPYELQTYGDNLNIPEYAGRQFNEIKIAEEWLKAWWDDGTVVLTMLWSRVKSAGTTIILTTVLKKIMGDLVLETLGWLNPQKWFRTVVCNTVTLGFPGVQQLCENKYFFAFASCAVMTLASQGTYNAGLCAPEDWRKVGYEDCHLCNDDEVNACTSSRCLGLGTDCVYESGICDASEDALERCDETLNDDMIITTDLSGVFEVNHSSPFHEFEFQTSKSSNCRYSKEPVNFDAMIRLTNLDRAGLNHRGNFWAGDNLLDDYKYYLQCSWACDEEDWGEEKSPLYELNIHRLPKPDEEAPIIIESYPYPAQLLESTNSVVMWVEADESLESCKYAELDFDSFQAETDALVADQTSGSEVSKEEGESAVDNLLLGLGLTNPSIPMERSADNKFQINIDGLENGESYAYSIVCEDYSALSTPSRPKIILFRVSNPFDVSIINPEHLSSTSRHIKEIKASSGSLETECKYSFEVKKQYSEMGIFDTTGSRAHTTQLVDPLRSGNYDLYVSCVNFDTLDLATGHSQFTIIPDVTAPRLARITGGNKLTIETDEYTNCTYSDEDFDAEQIPMTNSGDGANGFFIEHSLQTSDASSYYILCQDMDGNQGNFIIYP